MRAETSDRPGVGDRVRLCQTGHEDVVGEYLGRGRCMSLVVHRVVDEDKGVEVRAPTSRSVVVAEPATLSHAPGSLGPEPGGFWAPGRHIGGGQGSADPPESPAPARKGTRYVLLLDGEGKVPSRLLLEAAIEDELLKQGCPPTRAWLEVADTQG